MLDAPPSGGEVSRTAGATHTNVAELYTWPDEHVPHAAEAVFGAAHTGVLTGQSLDEPEPAFPRHAGVTQTPAPVLHTWPDEHCGSSVHCTMRLPELVAPPLLARIVSEPRARFDDGVHVHVLSDATAVEQTFIPLADTETI